MMYFLISVSILQQKCIVLSICICYHEFDIFAYEDDEAEGIILSAV